YGQSSADCRCRYRAPPCAGCRVIRHRAEVDRGPKESTGPPPGFRDIALQGKDASWFIFVPGSTVPKGTVPKLWVFKSPFPGEKRVTVLIQVDVPDGRTVK